MSTLNGGPSVIRDGLILYLDAANTKSYPTSGVTWSNLILNNSVNLINGPSFDVNNKGNILLDGVNDYIDLNASLPWQQFTYTCTYKLLSLQPTLYTYFFQNGSAYAVSGVYTEIANATGYFAITISNISATPSVTAKSYGGVTASPGKTYEVTNTFDGSIMTIYINGAFGATASGIIAGTPSGIFQFGRSGNYSPNINLYRIIVYNRALTSGEILQNYNASKKRFGI
jgi:hypothetical protein